MDYIFNRCLQ